VGVRVTAKQLIARAAECQACGKEHKPRKDRPGYAPSWADRKDGHPYRPRLRIDALAALCALADAS